MKRLTALDGFSLHAETDVMRTHAGGVLLVDPHTTSGELTADALLNLLAERTPGAPSFRKRLVGKPFGLGQPVWVDDPDFDVWQHLHRVTLPAPGTRRELAGLAGELHSRRQDRNRPLWDAWVVDGLDDGQIAVIIQLSHAMTDGVGGITSMLPQLVTTDPNADYPPLPDITSEKMPNAVELIGDMAVELANNTLTTTRVALKAAPAVLSGATMAALQPARKLWPGGHSAAAEGKAASGERAADDSPRTALNLPITHRRSVAFATVQMADLKAVRDARGVTINDVFLAAATSSVRRWLEVHDTVPTTSLRTLMPINTRTDDDASSNSWTLAVVKLPVYLADPAEQLATIHAATTRIKTGRKSAPAFDLTEVLKVVPPILIGGVANVYTQQKLSRFHTPLAHLATSNIPGPSEELYCGGGHVTEMYATPPLYEGANLNITAVSHGGVFDIAVIACPDNVKDVESVARELTDTVRELVG
jgi:WS/DGAT/MGAT family acyltransferase